MRGPSSMAVAVRRAGGDLVVLDSAVPSQKAGIRRWPLLRGVATLVESLTLGYRALTFSAEQAIASSSDGSGDPPGSGGDPHIEAKTAPPRAKEPSQRLRQALVLSAWLVLRAGEGESPPPRSSCAPDEQGSRWAIMISTLVALGLFVALPQAAAELAQSWLGWELTVQDMAFHALTGAFKLMILTLYLTAISRLEDVRRLFQYHGAEHKTIFAYEQGLALTVPSAKKQPRLHPRCGTTFLIVVVAVSIVVGSVVTPLLLPDTVQGLLAQILTLGIRIAMLPVIASISYELQRLSARYCTTGPRRMLLWPGFLFQRITTREPTEDQLEVAIAAMQTAMWREAQVGREKEPPPRSFASYASFREAHVLPVGR